MSIISVSLRWLVGLAYGNGRDVGKIGGNTRGVDDIVEGELINVGGQLQEKREGLIVISR